MAFKRLSQEEIRQIDDEPLIEAFLEAIREIDTVGISRKEEEEASDQVKSIKAQILRRMSVGSGWIDFGAREGSTDEERALLQNFDDIAKDILRMSDAEVAEHLEMEGLGHLVRGVDAFMDEMQGDSEKAVKLILVWDRDKGQSNIEE